MRIWPDLDTCVRLVGWRLGIAVFGEVSCQNVRVEVAVPEFGVRHCEEHENRAVAEAPRTIVHDIRNSSLRRCREFLFTHSWDFVVVDFEFEGPCKAFLCLLETPAVW